MIARWPLALYLVATVLAATPGIAAADIGDEAVYEGPAIKPPPGIRTHSRGQDEFYTDSVGKTLYFGITEEGMNCIGFCRERWTPVIAKSGGQYSGSFKPVKNIDGEFQWSFNGRPLFTYYRDKKPGDTFGTIEGIWLIAQVARPLPVVSLPNVVQIKRVSPRRFAFMDREGQPIFLGGGKRGGRTACEAACLLEWRPLAASMLARQTGDWTVVRRSDGALQWAFRGRPAYVPLGDEPEPEAKTPWRRAEL